MSKSLCNNKSTVIINVELLLVLSYVKSNILLKNMQKKKIEIDVKILSILKAHPKKLCRHVCRFKISEILRDISEILEYYRNNIRGVNGKYGNKTTSLLS